MYSYEIIWVDLPVYRTFIFTTCVVLWLELTDLANIWDILILKRYSLFIRKSNLIRHPLFYLATQDMDFFRSNHIADCILTSKCSCIDFCGTYNLLIPSSEMDPSVISSSLAPVTTLWLKSLLFIVSTITTLLFLRSGHDIPSFNPHYFLGFLPYAYHLDFLPHTIGLP